MDINLRKVDEFSSENASTKTIQELLDRHLIDIKSSTAQDFQYMLGMNYRARKSQTIQYLIRALTDTGAQVEVVIEKHGPAYLAPSVLKSARICC